MDSNNFNIDLDALKKLSPEEQKAALEILKQYAETGKSDLYDSLKNYDWEEVPVDIDTFLHDRRYLGNALYDAEGNFTLFAYWEKCLKDIFPTNTTTKYNTIVFTGAIGLGKSTIAVICLLYMLYRLLCLKDPYQYYGMQSIDKLSISLMNITLENARGVALDKLNSMLLSSAWFLDHGEMHGTTNMKYVTRKHIEIICASSNNQIIGRALFANFTDEVNFSLVQDPVKAKKKMMKIITQIDARQKSRFMRGTYLPTLNIIASSKDSEQSFLEEFIQNKVEHESKNTLIVSEPQWVVDPRKDSPEKFWVAVGDKTLANELLPLNPPAALIKEFKDKGYDMWQVPIGYLDTFQLNLDEAICSIIGIATAATLKYISGNKLNQVETTDYKNMFTQDILEIGEDDDKQYSEFFNTSELSEEDLERPMFMHLDLSESGDMTGIAGVWVTGKNLVQDKSKLLGHSFNQVANQVNKSISSDAQMLVYKLAFSVSIAAPRGGRISTIKHRIFINWLKEQGFNIKGVSSDTHQSSTLISELRADGFNAEVISVDRTTPLENKKKVCMPYYYFKNAIYERRVVMYETELLHKEIIELEKEADGHINHPENGKYGSKDQADAVCGAIWGASQHVAEYAKDLSETITISKAATAGTNEEPTRKQLVVSFEEMLNQCALNKLTADLDQDIKDKYSKEEIDEYNYRKDIHDGIICF